LPRGIGFFGGGSAFDLVQQALGSSAARPRRDAVFVTENEVVMENPSSSGWANWAAGHSPNRWTLATRNSVKIMDSVTGFGSPAAKFTTRGDRSGTGYGNK